MSSVSSHVVVLLCVVSSKMTKNYFSTKKNSKKILLSAVSLSNFVVQLLFQLFLLFLLLLLFRDTFHILHILHFTFYIQNRRWKVVTLHPPTSIFIVFIFTFIAMSAKAPPPPRERRRQQQQQQQQEKGTLTATTETKGAEGVKIIPPSVRADGSMRKPIRIRQGYVNQDEVPKYVAPALRGRRGKKKEEEEEEKKSSTTFDARRANDGVTAKAQEKTRLVDAKQQQDKGDKEKKTIVLEQKTENTPREDDDDDEDDLKNEILRLKKQVQQCERIERKRIEDESKVRPREWAKLGEYDETVDALEKLQRDLANLQFPAPEKSPKKK